MQAGRSNRQKGAHGICDKLESMARLKAFTFKQCSNHSRDLSKVYIYSPRGSEHYADITFKKKKKRNLIGKHPERVIKDKKGEK